MSRHSRKVVSWKLRENSAASEELDGEKHTHIHRGRIVDAFNEVSRREEASGNARWLTVVASRGGLKRGRRSRPKSDSLSAARYREKPAVPSSDILAAESVEKKASRSADERKKWRKRTLSFTNHARSTWRKLTRGCDCEARAIILASMLFPSNNFHERSKHVSDHHFHFSTQNHSSKCKRLWKLFEKFSSSVDPLQDRSLCVCESLHDFFFSPFRLCFKLEAENFSNISVEPWRRRKNHTTIFQRIFILAKRKL